MTQIQTNWTVTNQSTASLRLLTARLLKPRVDTPSVHCDVLTRSRVRRPNSPLTESYAVGAPVSQNEMGHFTINFFVHRRLQRPGTRLKVVFGVTDQFGKEHRLKPLRLWVVDGNQTKVFRVRYYAGDNHSRTPQTPVKAVTVYLPSPLLRAERPADIARSYADQLVGSEIKTDPRFRDVHHFEVEWTDGDLSKFGRPDREFPGGAKAWRNSED